MAAANPGEARPVALLAVPAGDIWPMRRVIVRYVCHVDACHCRELESQESRNSENKTRNAVMPGAMAGWNQCSRHHELLIDR